MITIYLAGDSTCAQKVKSVFPETGWGQALPALLIDEVSVSNHAVNGRSTKSFIDEGRLAAIKEDLMPGDWLFIQFGHNDQKDDPERYSEPYGSYQGNLMEFVSAAREKGAHPLFLSSICRRLFVDGRLEGNTLGEYPDAMKVLAEKADVPFIDMTEITRRWLMEKGDEPSRPYYLVLKPGEWENYPEGKEDNTHLSKRGAERIARFVAEELKRIPEIGAYAK